MNMGTAVVDSSFLVWGMTPGTPATVPCSAYLIQGGDMPIMVDCGFRDAEELTASSGIPFEQTADQTLESNLERHNLRPEDIGLLVFTHLHLDHTGYVDKLPNARLSIQRSELQYAAAPYFPLPFYDRVDIPKIVGPLFDRIDFLEGDAEIAPGVRAIHTGGHSVGHQMIEIDVESGLAVITGDLCYLADPGVTDQLPSGYTTSISEAMQGLARIKRTADHMLAMHDFSVFEKYPEGVR
jgi:glyoxylase-like metal-dependent hydrolase (beta-lactamase superfamily II)